MKSLIVKCIPLIVSIFTIIIDQMTKFFAITYLYKSTEITNFFSLTLNLNKGISFGMFNTSEQQQLVFIVITLCIISAVSWALISIKNKTTYLVIAFSLIIGGAIGNLIDRINVGAVIDFIDLHYMHYYFPIFNLADVAICCGSALIMMHELCLGKKS